DPPGGVAVDRADRILDRAVVIRYTDTQDPARGEHVGQQPRHLARVRQVFEYLVGMDRVERPKLPRVLGSEEFLEDIQPERSAVFGSLVRRLDAERLPT